MHHQPLVRQGYLAQHGAVLIDQGYNIVPIQPGKKAPGFDGWQKTAASKPQLNEWLSNGHKHAGVGINTKFTPALDIDVYDDEFVEEIKRDAMKIIGGPAPERVGQAPKTLLLYRTDTPFRKMSSSKWKDDFGAINQLEVLADGQQCVAYHKHPDTGKPYVWTHEGQNPLLIPARELITVTQEQFKKLLERFDERSFERGYEQVKSARLQASAVDLDNPWIEDTNTVDISTEDLRARLLLIPNPEDYDTWYKVGMALYHQYDGDEEGLKLWHEWSETADNYDSDQLDRRWEGFDEKGKHRAPVTARYILKLAQDAATDAREKLTMELHDKFREAKTFAEWDAACAATRVAEINSISRSRIAAIAKARNDDLSGSRIPLAEVKKALAYLPKVLEHIPKWCANWVYDGETDRFFHTEQKITRTKQGFDAAHSRESFTKADILEGRARPTYEASELATKHYGITNVDGLRYMPGDDAIVTKDHHTYANTYDERELPAIPDVLTPREKQDQKIVLAHIDHLLPPKQARMFLDTLSWIVQNPGKHMNYATVLQGVEGDGKSFFAEMMRAVMGSSNVTMLNAQILHSAFTDWATGTCVVFIEEVRIINDGNRYDPLNMLKPYITNIVIEIHPKGKTVYNTINTVNYILFTNYKDALPIDDNSRRYCVFFSKWQSRARLEEFNRANPNYYARLYETFEVSPGALRKMLLNHEQSADFNPYGNAPETAAKRHMVYLSKHEFIQALEAAIETNESHLLGPDIITSNALHEMAMSRGVNYPQGKHLTSMLSRSGYDSLGTRRIEGDVVTVWAREADTFYAVDANGRTYVQLDKIHELIKQRKAQIQSDSL